MRGSSASRPHAWPRGIACIAPPGQHAVPVTLRPSPPACARGRLRLAPAAGCPAAATSSRGSSAPHGSLSAPAVELIPKHHPMARSGARSRPAWRRCGSPPIPAHYPVQTLNTTLWRAAERVSRPAWRRCDSPPIPEHYPIQNLDTTLWRAAERISVQHGGAAAAHQSLNIILSNT